MKHDLRAQPSGADAERFRAWLASETIAGLRRAFGNGEAAKAAVFLYVNRAYEARMPEEEIGGLFGECVVQAGYRESDEEAMFAWLEAFGEVARNVHGSG